MIVTTARLRGSALFLLMSVSYGWTAQVQPPTVTPPQTLRPATGLTTVIKSQHVRLPFPKDIQRVAVGDAEILSFELINNREILVLGRDTGRTTLIVWFADGTLREYVFAVHRDLSVLQGALRRVHPAIEVESAPDRDAIILTGTVPNILVSQTAEAVARNYLDAGETRRGISARPFLSAQSGAPPAPPDAAAGGAAAAGAPGAQPPAAQAPAGPAGATRADAVRLQGEVQPSGTIINLLRLETLPALPEEKIKDAIQPVGGQRVTIRRILHGNLRDDTKDTLLLEGTVRNQIALVRVLEVAVQLFVGQTISSDDIHVVADESGALAGRSQETQGQNTQLGTGGGVGALFGGSRSSLLTNQIRRNLGRATAIEAAGGRVLSFIEVGDLPQIRVDIRLLEVNRTRLRSYNPDSALLTSNFRQPSLNPAQSAVAVQGNQAARVGGVASSAVQNVLSFLGGGLLNQFQLATQHAAVDVALSLLEREGIARSLSSPSLTVLSGELAQFQVGGEVPIPVAFAPAFGSTTATTSVTVTPGVFSSVEFIPFGVQLQIRPLVGDDDTITLDVQPQIVTPDAVLTDTIRQTTGTNPLTTAFKTRALRTSSRLQDGQALLIGGLTTNDSSNNTASTPGARDVPGLGWLFRSFNRNDESVELVVVVNPVIVRTGVTDAALWAFPSHEELMKAVVIPPLPPAKPPPKPNPNKGGA